MTNTSLPPAPVAPRRPSRFHFGWVLPVFLRPRQAFAEIVSHANGSWLTPLLLLTLAALLQVGASGYVRQQMALTGEMQLPPDFQYYTPEQQAQFMQAAQATQSPVFLYVLPAAVRIGQIWLGWLLVGGLLHLILTMLGGRGDTGAALNLVAWAGLPLGVRDLVQAVAIFSSGKLIQSTGFAGFVDATSGGAAAFAAAFLALVDIYLIWHIALLIVGVNTGTALARPKVWGGVLVTLLFVLSFQALIGFGLSQLGGTSIIRPFF